MEKLGFEGNKLGGVESVLAKVEEYSVGHRELLGRYRGLVEGSSRKEEELVKTKEKVT